MLLGNTAVNVIYLNKEGKTRVFDAYSCNILFSCFAAYVNKAFVDSVLCRQCAAHNEYFQSLLLNKIWLKSLPVLVMFHCCLGIQTMCYMSIV